MSVARQVIGLLILLLTATTSSTDDPNSTSVLRIIARAVPNIPEMVGYEYNASGYPIEITGLVSDYLQWFAMKHDLNPIIVRLYFANGTALDVSAPSSTSANGIIQDLSNDVADIALAASGSRPAYNPNVTFSFSFLDSDFLLYIPYPESGSHTWSFIRPYNLETWNLVCICLFLLPLLTKLLNRGSRTACGREPSRKEYPYGVILIYFLSVITAQGGWLNVRRCRSSFAVAVSWCLASIILVNAYNGRLIAYLTLNEPAPLVTSIEDLVNRPGINFYTYNNSQISFVANATTLGSWKKLGDILRQNPSSTVSSLAECLEKIEQGPNVCIAPREFGDRYMNKRFNDTGKCTVASVGHSVLTYRPAFILRKQYNMSATINRGVTLVRSFGLERKWIQKYRNPKASCRLELHRSAKRHEHPLKLSLSRMEGAYIVLLIGIALASVCFVIENLVYYGRKRKFTR